eukprot:CAMPEP_0184653494 /NCGR_PEP_ID=MMETSP0308-20130426/11210_1 /TAXON_ID=38269 /ORGANISM="Gloeochaete witrockiana, Strain SAG 46.84" /LENGTH=58 /DNA_ID=CAMNT_0027088979 /DNA_START=234 /DNA_END=406 /DNA_ORIENTATION=+
MRLSTLEGGEGSWKGREEAHRWMGGDWLVMFGYRARDHSNEARRSYGKGRRVIFSGVL